MLKKFALLCQMLLLINTALAETDVSQQRIKMLESALAPHSAAGVAQSWAEAAKQRNGAVQYMLLCPALQKKNLSDLQDLNWVTGLSSPQVGSYKITALNNNRFKIAYQMQLNNKDANVVTDQLSIVKIAAQANSSQQWCINKFIWLTPAAAH